MSHHPTSLFHMYTRDRALRHLRRGCANLKRLDILSCVNITRYVCFKTVCFKLVIALPCHNKANLLPLHLCKLYERFVDTNLINTILI